MKVKRLLKIALCLIAGVLLLGITAYYHNDIPGFNACVEVATGTGFIGWRKGSVSVAVDGEIHRVKAYEVRIPGENGTAIYLAGIPYPHSGVEYQNLKVGNNYIGRFNDDRRQFLPMSLAMIAGECVAGSWSLEDNVKGWDTEYRITANGDVLDYEILPAPPYYPASVEFSLPKSWLIDIPTTNLDQIVDGNTITVRPYRKQHSGVR